MLPLTPAAEPLIRSFAPCFTRPSYRRFVVLLVGIMVTCGRRTVSRILWTVRSLAEGHPSSYHRFFSAARWSLWPLARVLAAAVLELIPADEAVLIAADDTVAAHNGKKVYARGCHRDAVRSSRGLTVRKWGHKWVVLAALVKLPFAKRRWALPLLCALYRPRDLNQKEHRRHKVPSQLAQQLLAALLHWFPQRRFIFLGDGHFSGHELADFARRHRDRVTLIGRLRKKANLYARPPAAKARWRRRGRHRCGRTALKGRKLPSPAEHVTHAKRHRLTVRWYGDSKRSVHVVSGKGLWYRTGCRAWIRWVYVRDPQGGRSDYFYSTDARMSPRRIIETFAARWSIEVTFQEVRAHLGWETTRQRQRPSVLRTAPCLLGCFSLISLIYARHVRGRKTPGPRETCYRKSSVTFADALFYRAAAAVVENHFEPRPAARIGSKISPACQKPPAGAFGTGRVTQEKCRSRGDICGHFATRKMASNWVRFTACQWSVVSCHWSVVSCHTNPN